MRFAYYDNLGALSQRTYRRSDKITRVEVPGIEALVPLARSIEPALATGDPATVEPLCQELVDALDQRLATPPVEVRIFARRPANAEGELHGLYEPDEVTGGKARISVWMRTAALDKVVKYRTFLRTLLHEYCHHLDYEHYRLAETFHTQGFYSRESALTRELLGEKPRVPPDPGKPA